MIYFQQKHFGCKTSLKYFNFSLGGAFCSAFPYIVPAREEQGSMVPRYVVTEQGISETRYPMNQEPVVFGTQGYIYQLLVVGLV